jgi:hypothetical protein
VIVMQSSFAKATGDVGGTADDGLGDTAVVNTTDGTVTSQGVHYQVVTNPRPSFSVTCAPYVHSLQVAAPSPDLILTNGSIADVNYSIVAYPIRLEMSGVLNPYTGVASLIIGQPFTATVDSGGLASSSQDSYTWTESGCAPFTSYTASLGTAPATYTPFSLPLPTSSVLRCYFAQGGPSMISCSYHSGTASVDVNLSVSPYVDVPIMAHSQGSLGKMMLLRNTQLASGQKTVTPDVQAPNDFVVWGAKYVPDPAYPTQTLTYGAYYDARVKDPMNPLGQPLYPGSTGAYGFAQTLHSETQVRQGNAVVLDDSGDGLDHEFTYASSLKGQGPLHALWPSDVTSQDFAVWSDRPGISNLDPTAPYLYHVYFDLNLYMFYIPPSNGNGAASFVPLGRSTWQVRGDATKGTPWSFSDGGTSGLGDPERFPIFPTWTRTVN